MKKYVIAIIVAITIISVTSFLNVDENGIEGLNRKTSFEFEIESDNENIEIWEEDSDGDLIIKLEEWKTFADKQYIPKLENKVQRVSTNEYKSKVGNDYIPMEMKKILEILNPTNAGVRDILRNQWTFTYGITQINLKLLPLANYYYPDFQMNKTSQLKFLKYYIDTKIEKGNTINDILNEYKYGIYK